MKSFERRESHIRPQRAEQKGTYFVADKNKREELERLVIQDRMVTAAMGGVLAEQPDVSSLQRVLDISCGPGNWALEIARAYPSLSLVGIDISPLMIEYANAQAQEQQLSDRVTFLVMDALMKLDFPDASFGLVNLRFGSSFLRTWEWSPLINEMLRVTRPNGVLRITDSMIVNETTSEAMRRFFGVLIHVGYKTGRSYSEDPAGVTGHLEQLLRQHGCLDVRTQGHAYEYKAGTPEMNMYIEDTERLFQTVRPFIQKFSDRGDANELDAICKQASADMRRPDFHTVWRMLTAWGRRPEIIPGLNKHTTGQ